MLKIVVKYKKQNYLKLILQNLELFFHLFDVILYLLNYDYAINNQTNQGPCETKT